MALRSMVELVVLAEISRELPTSSVRYSEDGGGVHFRNFDNH